MHPAGIKFGLSHGLLQLSGDGAVLSPPLLESISEMARHKVRRRKRVIWIWDEAVTAGLRKVLVRIDAPRQEVVPFCTGLDRIIFETMMPIAEKAKIAERYGKHFSSEHTFYRKFRNDIRRPHMRLEANMAWRLHFRGDVGAHQTVARRIQPGRHAACRTAGAVPTRQLEPIAQ